MFFWGKPRGKLTDKIIITADKPNFQYIDITTSIEFVSATSGLLIANIHQ